MAAQLLCTSYDVCFLYTAVSFQHSNNTIISASTMASGAIHAQPIGSCQARPFFKLLARVMVILSVRPSVCHTGDAYLNGITSIYRLHYILCTTRKSDVSSLLRPNFTIQNSGVHSKQEAPLCQKR